MLSVSVAVDPALQHDPAVKIDIGRLDRHRIIQKEIDVIRLVEGVDTVPGPLQIGNDLTRDHVSLSGFRLERVGIVLYVLQVILNRLDRIRRDVIHFIFQFFQIFGIRCKGRIRQKIMLQRADRRKVGIADVVLDRDPSLKFRISEDLPGGRFLLRHEFRIVDDTCDSPHISGRVLAPALPADLTSVEDVFEIGRDSPRIVIVLVRSIVKMLGQRNQLSLVHELHEHVLGGADKVVFVPQRQHVVEVLIRAERGVLHLYALSIGLVIPVLIILPHRVDADDVSARKIDRLLLVPVAEVDILLPVADAKPDDIVLLLCGKCSNRERADRNDPREDSGERAFSEHTFSHTASFLLPGRILAVTTIRTTIRKITAERAQSAVLISVCAPFVAFTT